MIFVLFYANKLRILFTMFTTMAPKGIELWIMIICHVWQVMVDGRYGSYKFHSDNKKKSILCSQMNCNWTGGSASREPRDIGQILPHACFWFIFFFLEPMLSSVGTHARPFLFGFLPIFLRFPTGQRVLRETAYWFTVRESPVHRPTGDRLPVHRDREPRASFFLRIGDGLGRRTKLLDRINPYFNIR
jgi:hypothetical protein